jgi:hypothetical protein
LTLLLQYNTSLYHDEIELMACFCWALKRVSFKTIPTVLSFCGANHHTAKYPTNDNQCHLMSTRNVSLHLTPQTGCQHAHFDFP